MTNGNGFNFTEYATEQAQTLTKLWMDSVSRMTGAAFAFTPGSSLPEMARQAREAVLSAMGHSMESYMRSEPFLQTIKQSMDMAMDMRKQFMQGMTQLQHGAGAPAYEDIRSLMQGMRHFEGRLVRRLDQLTDRLESIELKLDTLESREFQVEDAEDDSQDEQSPGQGNSTTPGQSHQTSPARFAGRTRKSASRVRKPGRTR